MGMIAVGEIRGPYYNWGRWVMNCSTGCNNAEEIDPSAPTFACHPCKIAESVEMPEDWEHIEAVLSLRPFERNRNWHPGETLADLLRENGEHGCPSGGV